MVLTILIWLRICSMSSISLVLYVFSSQVKKILSECFKNPCIPGSKLRKLKLNKCRDLMHWWTMLSADIPIAWNIHLSEQHVKVVFIPTIVQLFTNHAVLATVIIHLEKRGDKHYSNHLIHLLTCWKVNKSNFLNFFFFFFKSWIEELK